MSKMNNYFNSLNEWFDDKPTDTIEKCIICGNASENNSMFKETDEITICNNCGFVFRKYQPTNEVLDEFYKESKPMTQWADIKLKDDVRQNNKFKSIVDFINLHKIKNVLDYGSGNGYFLKMISKFTNSVGYDPNEAAIKEAKKHGIEIVNSVNNLKKGSFELLTLFGVLEHLKDIPTTFSNLLDLLEPNGRIAIIVPNVDSLVVKTLGEKCCTFCPQHLWYFNKDSLTNLFKKYNFKLECFKTVESEINPILNIYAGREPYFKRENTQVHPTFEQGFKNYILLNDLGYKIIAIFKKNK